jgi:membrane-associated phospholipid phosphatase
VQNARLSRSCSVTDIVLTTVTAASFIIIGIVFRETELLRGWETRITSAAQRHPPPWAHAWASLFTRDPFVLITVSLTAVALFIRRWSLAFAGAIGCAAAVIAAEHVFKQLMDGYPSAHVTGAAASAMFAWFIVRNRRVASLAVFLIPVVVAWAVVAQGLHSPIESVGGLLLGTAAVGATVLVASQGATLLATRRKPFPSSSACLESNAPPSE